MVLMLAAVLNVFLLIFKGYSSGLGGNADTRRKALEQQLQQ